jgi:hypothetical protein
MKDSKKSNSDRGRKFLTLISFEIEVEGRSPYTFYDEIDLKELDCLEFIEDYDEEQDFVQKD